MGHYKNIKRNSTRPEASKRPFVSSIYGKRSSDTAMKEIKRIEAFNAKLESWKSLCK